jgi:radial spoke head protein 4A
MSSPPTPPPPQLGSPPLLVPGCHTLPAPVAGHPPFPGREANLLRATIALISADTQLALAGSLVAVEGDENGAVEPNGEEWEAPDLSGADGWVHAALEINALGRTRPNPPVMDAEGNEVPMEGAPEPSAPLKGVGEDPPVDEAAAEGGGAWLFAAGPVSGLAEGEAPAGPFVAKSLRWPGAVTVGMGKRCAGAYVGWGLPVSTAPYQPALPATGSTMMAATLLGSCKGNRRCSSSSNQSSANTGNSPLMYA